VLLEALRFIVVTVLSDFALHSLFFFTLLWPLLVPTINATAQKRIKERHTATDEAAHLRRR
jgi:hypothetical protein